jgi:hypothetical protein
MTTYDSQLGKLITGAPPAIEPSQEAETLGPDETKELFEMIEKANQAGRASEGPVGRKESRRCDAMQL